MQRFWSRVRQSPGTLNYPQTMAGLGAIIDGLNENKTFMRVSKAYEFLISNKRRVLIGATTEDQK